MKDVIGLPDGKVVGLVGYKSGNAQLCGLTVNLVENFVEV
jgi:hypothetical protein